MPVSPLSLANGPTVTPVCAVPTGFSSERCGTSIRRSLYQAISNQEVDVICAFATDGRIAAFDLQPLQDDLGFFPPYQAAPVFRAEVLETHPELRQVLDLLAGILDDTTMQRLNFEVDENKHRPRDVAREFLQSHGLLKKEN